jgi:hypothetical protein
VEVSEVLEGTGTGKELGRELGRNKRSQRMEVGSVRNWKRWGFSGVKRRKTLGEVWVDGCGLVRQVDRSRRSPEYAMYRQA